MSDLASAILIFVVCSLFVIGAGVVGLSCAVRLQQAAEGVKAVGLGRGLPVLLVSTLCVIVGAPLGYLAVSPWLPAEAWTGYGALAGSWIGGTGNMAAMERALGTPADQMGLAILADQAVFLVWLPLLIVSARYADPFNRWVNARPIAGLAEADEAGDAERNELPGRDGLASVT